MLTGRQFRFRGPISPANLQLLSGPFGSVTGWLSSQIPLGQGGGYSPPCDDEILRFSPLPRVRPLAFWTELTQSPASQPDPAVWVRPTAKDFSNDIKRISQLVRFARNGEFNRGRLHEWDSLCALLGEDANLLKLNQYFADKGIDLQILADDRLKIRQMYHATFILLRRSEGVINSLVQAFQKKIEDLMQSENVRLASLFLTQLQILKNKFSYYESGMTIPEIHLEARVDQVLSGLKLFSPRELQNSEHLENLLPGWYEISCLAYYGLPEALLPYLWLSEIIMHQQQDPGYDHASTMLSSLNQDIRRLLLINHDCEQLACSNSQYGPVYDQANAYVSCMLLLLLTTYIEITCHGKVGTFGELDCRRGPKQVLAYLSKEILGKDHPFVKGLSEYALGII